MNETPGTRRGELSITRVLNAPRSLVWEAFTSPEHLSRFWGGAETTVAPESIVMDLRAGGVFSLVTVAPDGAEYPLRFEYVDVQKPSRMVFVEPDTGLTTTITLIERDSQTELSIHQIRVPEHLQTEQAQEGLAAMTTKLAALLTLLQADTDSPISEENPLSTLKDVVNTYFDGFRRSDHDLILSCLTDDVVWDLPGFRHLKGKEAFDSEIENDQFVGSPTLVVDRLIQENGAVVAVGSGEGTFKNGDLNRFAFCDVFTFTADKISRVESYLVPLTTTD